MTTIHMNVDAMWNIQRNVMEVQGLIQRKAQPLRNDYAGLPYHWIGNSANEYFSEYEEFEAVVSSVVEKLSEIASELAEEISRWESMDNGLSR
ncbi:MAG: hypothetical protein ACOYZ8_06810 [Chloroflexota bacterium]